MGLFSRLFKSENKVNDATPSDGIQDVCAKKDIDCRIECHEEPDLKSAIWQEEHEVANVDKHESIDVLEPCDFNFDNIRRLGSVVADSITGEVENDKRVILLSHRNKEKFIADLMDLDDVFRYAIDNFPEFPAPSEFVEKLDYYGEEGRYSDYECMISTDIKIMPLTKSGKAKKYPIHVFADVIIPISFEDVVERRNGEVRYKKQNSMILHCDYMKDGSIGRGELIIWKEHEAYRLFFIKEKSQGGNEQECPKYSVYEAMFHPEGYTGGWEAIPVSESS